MLLIDPSVSFTMQSLMPLTVEYLFQGSYGGFIHKGLRKRFTTSKDSLIFSLQMSTRKKKLKKTSPNIKRQICASDKRETEIQVNERNQCHGEQWRCSECEIHNRCWTLFSLRTPLRCSIGGIKRLPNSIWSPFFWHRKNGCWMPVNMHLVGVSSSILITSKGEEFKSWVLERWAEYPDSHSISWRKRLLGA